MGELVKSKYKVLIVDDIAENLQIIGNMLRAKDIDISFTTSGKHAISIAELRCPDLILLDIAMPEFDGFSVCKELKNNDITKDIPIIFLTARTQMNDIIMGFEAGAVDYITKPFSNRELISRVFTHLELKRSRDIILEQNKMLEKKNEELTLSNITKDKLFSIVSHDLKNPFNNIMGFIEILVNNYDNIEVNKVKMFHNYIYQSILQVFNLLNNLLMWSRTQMKRIEINKVKLDINRMIEMGCDILMSNALFKDIKIEMELEQDCTGYGDFNLLDTVFRNLLSNAIKFTNKGGKIVVKSRKTETNIEVEILDNGIGIEKDAISKLFKIEHLYTTTGTNSEKGTGLGLIICKDFITLNDGIIWMESEVGKGSRFVFTVPRFEEKDINV